MTPANDQFTGVFGERRGGAPGGGARASRYEMPRCPEGGHAELAAIDRDRHRDGASLTWEVGWYGSNLTFFFWLDRDQQALWQHHHHLHGWYDKERHGFQDIKVEPLVLCHEDPYPHLRRRWDELPEDVQERIVREVSLGVHPLSGTTNDRPLNPF